MTLRRRSMTVVHAYLRIGSPQTGLFRNARSTVPFARPSTDAKAARSQGMYGSKKRKAGRKTKQVSSLAALAIVLSASISWADGASNHVRDVKVHAAEGIPGGTEIEVVGTGAPTFNVRVTEGGKRLLIDLSDADVVGAPEAITNPSGVVGGILTQAF